MRLYKTAINNNNEVLSYVMPEQVEKIYSIRTDETYDISLEALLEYIELTGYVIFPYLNPVDDITSIVYVDIDYQFTPWDKQAISYVTDQIHKCIRQKLIDVFFEDYEEPFLGKSDLEQHDLLGITGEEKIFKNEITYLYHKYKGGIWESSNKHAVEIDRYSGIISGNNIGECTITYQVDTGAGILTCFKTIEVIYDK